MRRQELHPRTAVINKSQKNQSRKVRHEALNWLSLTFPEAFDNKLRIRPLKIGIMKDILEYADKAEEAGISRSKLREAVVLFTRRIDYLACLKVREMRVDLAGNPVAMVSDDEAEKAALKIKKRIEKSVKNARKTAVVPTSKFASNGGFVRARQESERADANYNDNNPHHFERPPSFSAASATNPGRPAPAVIVRHKTTRQYDPDAVARLKEKLGLSRKANETNEMSE